MDGIVALWKPKGFTSHDCVSKARGMFKTKKIGHTGTLDPDVEGVLPLCVGKATKIVPFLTNTEKVYEAEITLGIATETEDASGEHICKKAVTSQLSNQEIKEVLTSFTGTIKQVPPMYSAVKVDGKKLYEYAREGKEVPRPEREVEIHGIELTSDGAILQDGRAVFSFNVRCSKGTYIRTLCVDIGKALGYPAHMSHLVRTATGGITKEVCLRFSDVQKLVDEGTPEKALLPISTGLSHLPSLTVDEQTKALIKNGRVLEKEQGMPNSEFTVRCGEEVLAVYKTHPSKPDKIKPVRVF
ncbi:tRNA pseudouridine(55) synthase TruB [Halobacillus salinarum]|uniref:tRNA pseudouridine synthase B n=1 Tax=Halobacillus salinarum TaxID=2932257 RepID=A0ABY4EEW7_9BACI|nr:tRNA pseudouridine(55) synthase TruB [Halobacillus salinarum]UOQ43014.1 tRNA pseudouridine(55) synthase TruB [Halobacillus salinarum]